MMAMNSSYYAATAYRSDLIPKQPPSVERSWLRRFAKMRLPWGMTQEASPDDFFSGANPAACGFRRECTRSEKRSKH